MLEEPDIPDKPERTEQTDYSRYFNAKFIGIIAFLIFIAGIITEFLNSIFSLGIPPGTSFERSIVSFSAGLRSTFLFITYFFLLFGY